MYDDTVTMMLAKDLAEQDNLAKQKLKNDLDRCFNKKQILKIMDTGNKRLIEHVKVTRGNDSLLEIYMKKYA